MSWTKAEQQIIQRLEQKMDKVCTGIQGDLAKGTPGMADDLRNMQQDTLTIRTELKTLNENNDTGHRNMWKVLCGVGAIALVALLLHWDLVGRFVISVAAKIIDNL